MTPRKLTIRGNRTSGPGTVTHSRANPLTLMVYPDEGALPIAGSSVLCAELLPSRISLSSPLATRQLEAPSGLGSGPWDLAFSGAQMNQDLQGKAERKLWLVVYALDEAGGRNTFYTGDFTITEDGASLESAVPPDVDVLLDQGTADGLYAPLSLADTVASLQEQLEGLVDSLEHVPMDITSLTVSPSVAEVGAAVTSLIFNWARNKVPATLSFNQGIGSVTPSLTTLTQAVSITASTTYTLTADDGTAYTGNSDTASATVSFQHKAYWGTSAATSLNSAGILGLANSAFGTSRVRSFTLDGGGQYLYYAYPASWGDAVFTMNGFVNNAWSKALVNFTNASGNTTSFAVWRTTTVQNADNIQISVS